MKGLPFPAVCAYLGIGLISVVIARGGALLEHSKGPIDDGLAVAAVFLIAWLLSGRRTSLVGSETHEHAGDSLAFRFGKALNRVLRGRRRSA